MVAWNPSSKGPDSLFEPQVVAEYTPHSGGLSAKGKEIHQACPPARSWIGPDKSASRVRREKVVVHSGRLTRPGTDSLHPVAIRAAVEATRLLKPLVLESRKATWRACRP